MSTNKFFTLNSKLSSNTVQVRAVNLSKKEDRFGLFDEHRLILGDYADISLPVIFKQEYGNKIQDFLDTGWPSLFLISDKLKVALEENSLTGWKTFDVKVLDKKGQEVLGYNGLSITGRCGKLDYNKSEIIEKQIVPNGPFVKYYKGLHIGLDEWDRTDFFLPQKNFGIFITQRAAEVLRKKKFENISLQNISEIEMDHFTVQVALQNQE